MTERPDDRRRQDTRFDSPLRRTTLSSLVDAASRAGGPSRRVKPATVGVVTALVGVLAVGLGVWGVAAGIPVRLVLGVATVFVGVTVGWTQMSFIMDDRLHPETHTSKLTVVITLVSALVVIVGVLVMFSGAMPLGVLLRGALAGLVMIAALAVIVAPWWISLIADLGAQRARTAREELRADIASRLHDSVLQTLALIQLQSKDATRVAALARAQERELREWLYGDPEAVATAATTATTGTAAANASASATANAAAGANADGGVMQGGVMQGDVKGGAARNDTARNGAARNGAARPAPVVPPASGGSPAVPSPDPGAQEPFSRTLKRVAATVEDAQEKPIDVVVVGECPYTPQLAPLLYAATEAMTNAAKHGAAPISVYMEATPGHVQVFVRDHGAGFDVARLPVGHLGVKESIIGRMKRAGGTAKIVSRPGWGTEVRLAQPLRG